MNEQGTANGMCVGGDGHTVHYRKFLQNGGSGARTQSLAVGSTVTWRREKDPGEEARPLPTGCVFYFSFKCIGITLVNDT